MNLLILTSCCGYLKRAYKKVILIFRTSFQIATEDIIAPVPTRDKTKADVETIINWSFPIMLEIIVRVNVIEIAVIAIMILDLIPSLMDLITSPTGQR